MRRLTCKTAVAAAVVLVVILCHLLPPVAAHAVLMKPKSRQQLSSSECAWCSQSGGPPAIKARGGKWPSKDYPAAHGLCGSPDQNTDQPMFKGSPYMKEGPVQATYKAGDVVEFEIGINTWHQGHYEFRICETGIHDGIASPEEGQKCLDKWLLKRAPLKPGCGPGSDFDCQPVDPDHPDRWLQSPQNAGLRGTKYDGNNPVTWKDEYAMDGPQPEDLSLAQEGSKRTQTINRVEKMRYIIPEGLSCQRCTLQFYWSSGNNCHYDQGDRTMLTRMKAAGWNIGPWSYIGENGRLCSGTDFGEEFWNCADIAVKSGAQPPPSPRRRESKEPTPRRRRGRSEPTSRRRRQSQDSSRRRRSESTPRRRRSQDSSRRRRSQPTSRRRRQSKVSSRRRRRSRRRTRRRGTSRRRKSKSTRRRRR